MATMTIRIAKKDTLVRDSQTGKIKPSSAGHMWFEVKSKNLNFSAGFSGDGLPVSTGIIEKFDNKNYAEAYYSATINISEENAKKLLDFRNNPFKYKFNSNHYHFLNNSCVDFVYKALEVIGVNKNYNAVFNRTEGDYIPSNNVDNLNALLKGKIIETISGKGETYIETGNLLRPIKIMQITKGKFNTVLNHDIKKLATSSRSAMPLASSKEEILATNISLLTEKTLKDNSANVELHSQTHRLIEAMASFGNNSPISESLTTQANNANIPQLALSAI